MAVDYTDWPKAKDVKDKLSAVGATLPNDLTEEYLQRQIDAVIEDIEKTCRRQFKASPEAEERAFDGSGTGELEIDEYISIESIRILGWFGTVTGFALSRWYEPQRNKFPKSRIQIYQGSLPALMRVWIDRFPEGRSNIVVKAVWGYGPKIPADLWEAVASEAAHRIVSELVFSTSGWLTEWQEADVAERRELIEPKKLLTWHKQYLRALRRYRKPDAVYLRKTSKKLV